VTAAGAGVGPTRESGGTDEGATTRGAGVLAGDVVAGGVVEGCAGEGCVLAGGFATGGDCCPASGEGCGFGCWGCWGCWVVTVRGRVCPVAGVWDWACAATEAKTISVNVTVRLFFIIKLSVSVKGLGPGL
jgi:hypothetical protein